MEESEMSPSTLQHVDPPYASAGYVTFEVLNTRIQLTTDDARLFALGLLRSADKVEDIEEEAW